MTPKEITEGNKLIARFLGGKLKLEFSHTEIVTFPDGRTFRVKNLKYHKDWNKLMPVVEKICRMNFGDDVTYIKYAYPRTFGMMNEDSNKLMVRFNSFTLHEEEELIDATFLGVVEVLSYLMNK